jgi:U3 small nucleolar RNA-associated protein 14
LLTVKLLDRAPGGAGVRPNPKAKRIIKKVTGIDPKSRADHDKPHVIISEKKDTKAATYLTKDLPYQYTSKTQFEKSMEI